MDSRKKQIYLLGFLILLLLAINYPFLDSALVKLFDSTREVFIERVIDGDTVVVNGSSIRLMGINTPEKGEKYYSEAKEFLEGYILNRTVELESFGFDKYNRELGYLFYNEKNVNVEIVSKGFANSYFYDEKKYEKEIRDAWEECVEKDLNYCEKSENKCSDCVELKELDVKEDFIILYNKCSFDCEMTGWTIKDEGRKKFVFGKTNLEAQKEIKIIVGEGKDSKKVLYWKGESYVWTSSGDTIFLRDNDDKLIFYYNY